MKKSTITRAAFLLGTTLFGSLSSKLTVTAQECYGYVDFPLEVESIHEEGEIAVLSAEELPAAYDSRQKGVVTSVKSQSPWETCWSFAAMAALESNLLSNQVVNTADLSETQFCYSNYKMVEDVQGGFNGDGLKTDNTFAQFLAKGGNVLIGFRALTSWGGCTEESRVPYPLTGVAANSITVGEKTENLIHLQQFYEISIEDVDALKKEIMNNGALTSSYYHNYTYFNSTTGAYYAPQYPGRNHAITIIGWDDNYSKSNFKEIPIYDGYGKVVDSYKPSNDGAWLAKNSWGENFGNNGYMWISYEDSSIGDIWCVLHGEKADNYDYIYQYDGSYQSSYILNPEKISNIFTVPSNAQKDQVLRAVSFETGSTNVEYSIMVYKNPLDSLNPESGEKLFANPVEGKCVYQGYHTIKLPKDIILKPGDSFAVVVTVNKESGEELRMVLETTRTWNNISYTASATEGQSLYYKGGKWTDVVNLVNNLNKVGNIRIKAFTSDALAMNEQGHFVDVNSRDWYFEAVEKVFEKNIMSGFPNGKFAPNAELLRSEMVTLLYNYEGPAICAYTEKFLDVPDKMWYTMPVLWAANEGITAGVGNNKFGVSNPITREQMIRMLYLYYLKKNPSGKGQNENKVNAGQDVLENFADKSQVSAWAKEAMEWAVNNKVITGIPDQAGKLYLAPTKNITRAESAMIMMKFSELVED